jgi:hypothetical protein
MEAKTCTLKVYYDDNKAALYFKDGVLIGAKTPDKIGKEAALEIFSMEKAEIDIDGKCRNTDTTIDIPLQYLLLESARLKDEKNKDLQEFEDLGHEIVEEIENALFSLLNINIPDEQNFVGEEQSV